MANEWFCSYLRKVTQFLSIEYHISTNKEMLTGVPRESILCSLLLLIYISDLHKSIRSSKAYHFADNASMIQSNSLLEVLSTKTN